MAGPELALREDWPRGVALRGADDMVALFCLSVLLLRRIGNLCFVPLLQGEGGFVRRGNERTAKKDNKSVFRLEALLGTNSISLRYVNHQQQNGGGVAWLHPSICRRRLSVRVWSVSKPVGSWFTVSRIRLPVGSLTKQGLRRSILLERSSRKAKCASIQRIIRYKSFTRRKASRKRSCPSSASAVW
jgi:hypothetical protein